jgi:hypothetical protein
MNLSFARITSAALVLALFILAAGCDKQRESLASAIQPRTAQQVAATANQLLGEGKFKEARTEGESFLAGNQDITGQLSLALAKASAQLGDTDVAVTYAIRAVAAGALAGVDLMAEPMLEPIRTDIRFVTLATGATAPATTPAQPAPAVQPSAPQTSATIDANGIEAKAGSVSVKLPN